MKVVEQRRALNKRALYLRLFSNKNNMLTYISINNSVSIYRPDISIGSILHVVQIEVTDVMDTNQFYVACNGRS